MAVKPLMQECFLCRCSYQYGPNVYDGRYFRAWDISVCNICVTVNADGIVPATHPHLLEHLKAKGIEIRLNRQGWPVGLESEVSASSIDMSKTVEVPCRQHYARYLTCRSLDSE